MIRSLLGCALMLACLGGSGAGQTKKSVGQVPDADLRAANQALAARDYRRAIKSFDKANKRVHNRCAACYLGLGRSYLGLAQLYHAKDDAHWALENCSRGLSYAQNNPLRAEAHECKGQVLLSLPQLDSRALALAEEEFRAATHLDKDTPRYHLDLGLTLLRELREKEGLDEVRTSLSLAPDGPDAYLAGKLLAHPERARDTFAPDIHFTTLQGESLSLAEMEGKVVLLHFWSTACREPTWAYEEHFGQLYPLYQQSWSYPCPDPVPALKALAAKYKPDQFVLISVNEGSDQAGWRDSVAKKNMAWRQASDAKGDLFKAFGLSALPAYVVIDADGVIAYTITGTGDPAPYFQRLSLLPPLSKSGGK